MLYCNNRNVTQNKDLAEVLEIDTNDLRNFFKFNACQMLGNNYVIIDGQNIKELLSKLKLVFSNANSLI